MQLLAQAQYIAEGRDAYMLQYLLRRQGMLSTTGYKVLQGQQAAGLIPCYRVIYDTVDKLDYDVEDYQDLRSLLPQLAGNLFLHYVRGILSIVLNMKNIGFLHPYNLETSLDKIFIDKKDHTVHMVYLPIAEGYQSYMNIHFDAAIKEELQKAIQENQNLQTDLVVHFSTLVADAAATLEHLQAALAQLEPPPQPAAAPTGTVTLSQTGEMSGGLEGGTGQPAQEEALPPPEEEAPPRKTKPARKGFFGGRGRTQPAPQPEASVGGTEVLSLFVPSMVLKGQGKVEFLIDRQEFLLGRDDAADGTVASTAISRKHCKISHSDGRNFVTDLGSANGTFLNGARVEPSQPRPINEGDKLKLGNVSFTVMSV